MVAYLRSTFDIAGELLEIPIQTMASVVSAGCGARLAKGVGSGLLHVRRRIPKCKRLSLFHSGTLSTSGPDLELH